MFRDEVLKINIKSKFIKRILIVSFIAIFFVLLAVSANAYERPEFKDGLTEKWHPGRFCIPCHYTLMETEKAREISNSCFKCHDNRPENVERGYQIDMSKIYVIHEDIVCIRCHVGTKEETEATAADFHRVMSKTSCLSCHTFENGTYQKPLKTSCSDCHGGDPHVVHGSRLEKMCVACHGEFGEKYSIPSPSNFSVSNMSAAEQSVEGFPTIGEIIIKIIEPLRQIMR